jgi:cytochrome b involved in lipid metabolism
MAATCGTDATAAYMTKDPNATNTTSGQDHSTNAKNMLKDYYLGALNETIGSTASKTANTTKNTTNTNTKVSNVSKTSLVPASSITLDMTEIAKHNKSSDCFLLISGKVYNITSFFGSHPGGNAVMATTCGTDATAAYMTKDPNATSSGSRSAHSSGATSMLASYYIGNFNQTIGQQKITETNAVQAPANIEDDDD